MRKISKRDLKYSSSSSALQGEKKQAVVETRRKSCQHIVDSRHPWAVVGVCEWGGGGGGEAGTRQSLTAVLSMGKGRSVSKRRTNTKTRGKTGSGSNKDSVTLKEHS